MIKTACYGVLRRSIGRSEPVLKRSLAFRKVATRNKYRNLRRSFLARRAPNAFVSVNSISSGVAVLFGLILRDTERDRVCAYPVSQIALSNRAREIMVEY